MFNNSPDPNVIGNAKKKAINQKPNQALTPNLNSMSKQQSQALANTMNQGQGGGKYVPPALRMNLKSSSSDSSSSSSSTSDSDSTPESNDVSSSKKRKRNRKLGKLTFPGKGGDIGGSNFGNNSSQSGGNNNRMNRDKRTPRVAESLGSNDFNKRRPDTQTGLMNVGTPNPTAFGVGMSPILTLNDGLLASYSSFEIIPKMFANLASIATGINTNGFMSEIYAIFNKDIIARARNATVTSVWSQANFLSYMTQMADCLQWFFTIKSILVNDCRFSSKREKIQDMITYQSKFEDWTNIVAKLDKLERVLFHSWFPPRLAQFILWFSQSYKAYDLEQSPIIRFFPTQTFLYDGTKAFDPVAIGTALDTHYTNVTSVTNTTIAALLGQIYPEGIIQSLPTCTALNVYDHNFTELFANQPILFVDQFNTNSNSGYPTSIAGSASDIPYYIPGHVEDTDGFVFAIQNVLYGSPYGVGGLASGLSSANTSLVSALSSTGMATNNNGSQFALTNGSNIWTRRDSVPSNLGCPSVHTLAKGAAAFAAYSAPPVGFQRVYFDTNQAPLVNNGYLMEWFFGFRDKVI